MIVYSRAAVCRDFIPKMIDGATQADCGILVVNSVAGEFETGLDKGGQTREHARLLRSVGVYELIVACNKMDDGGWSQQRYDEIVSIMSTFLATCGFKVDKKVTFVPTSGELLRHAHTCHLRCISGHRGWHTTDRSLVCIQASLVQI